MTGHLDGCEWYDDALMDGAVEGRLAPAVDEHVRGCARCQRAWAAYTTTRLAVTDAFRTSGRPRRRSTTLRAAYVLACSLTAAAILLIAFVGLLSEPATAMGLYPEEGAVVEVLGPSRARIDEGTTTFEFGEERGVVVTPRGELGCSNCSFTVEVMCAGNEDSLPAGLQGLVVRVTVAQGRVGSTATEDFRMVIPGEPVTLAN